MKIKKIFIQNFKWVKDAQILEFTSDITLLIWPNGFGKTTIFDALEICFTGNIYRINKTEFWDKRSSVWASFYQNDRDKPVIVKICIENAKNEQKMIIAYDNGNNKNAKPKALYFQRYISDFDDQEFQSETFNLINKTQLKDGDIETFLWLDPNKEKIDDIYKLFNYIQQEETSFFLKQSQSDRQWQLDFLFNTDKEVEKINKLKNTQDKVGKFEKKFQQIIDDLKKELENKKSKIIETNNSQYIRFFETEDNIKYEVSFDEEEPFKMALTDEEDLNKEKDRLFVEIQKLSNFLDIFSITEYEKYNKYNFFKEIIENEEKLFYLSIIDFYKKNEQKIWKYEKINSLLYNTNYINYILLENIFINPKEKNRIESEYSLFENIKKYDNFFELYQYKEYVLNTESFQKEVYKNHVYDLLNKENQIQNFLLKNLYSKKYTIKEYKSMLAAIKEDEKWLKFIYFHDFFNQKNWKISIFQEYENTYIEAQQLIEFTKTNNLDSKVNIFFSNILRNIEISTEIVERIKKLKEDKNNIENKIWDKKSFINTLNESRAILLSQFKKSNISFDNSCILCGTKQVNGKDIKNFEEYESFVNKKTEEFKQEIWVYAKDLGSIQKELEKIFTEIDTQIKTYIWTKNVQIELYENLKLQFSSIEDFNNYRNKNIFNSELIERYKFKNTKIDSINIDDFTNFTNNILNELKKYSDIPDFEEVENIELYDEIFKDYKWSDIDINHFSLELLQNEIKSFKNFCEKYINWFSKTRFLTIESLVRDVNFKEIIERINSLEIDNFSQQYMLDNQIKIEKLYNIIQNVQETINNIDFKSNIELIKSLNIKDTIFHIDTFDIESFNHTLDSFKNKCVENIKYYQWLFNFNEQKFQTISTKIYDIVDIEKMKKFTIQTEKNLEDLNKKIIELRSFLKEKQDNVKYNNNIINELNLDLFQKYFNENIELLRKYQTKKSELIQKYDYINLKFNNSLNSSIKYLNERIKKFEDRWKKLGEINKKLESAIKIFNDEKNLYQKQMVEVIQKPFFIYTWRILQNFQQGMWIFIHFNNENKDKTNKTCPLVSFYPSWKSENDAIHQLSSWQLSVVSIAFTLAVNKAYSWLKDLKFLFIDDPIQEMDALNVYWFIELMKYSFIDYFIILSTYNFNNATHIKYKFDKELKADKSDEKLKEVAFINVKDKFSALSVQKLAT